MITEQGRLLAERDRASLAQVVHVSRQPHSFRSRGAALEGRASLAVCTMARLTDVGAEEGMAGDVAALVASRLAQPGAVWQELTPVVITTARQQTVDGRPAARPHTAVTEDSPPSRNGSHGGAWREDGLGEAAWLVL